MIDFLKEYKLSNKSSQLEINEVFILACKNNDFGMVKYLFSNQYLSHFPDIDYRNSNGHSGPTNACQLNDFKILNYLLTSPELKDKADIHAHEDLLFIIAIVHHNFRLLVFLVMDMNIQKNNHIDKFISIYKNGYAEKLFRIRELKEELNKELKINVKNNIKSFIILENEIIKV